jgi:hypothetical protein
MSYPYPQDRHRDRQEKGTQPYQDHKEAMGQTQAQIQAGAEAYGEAHRDDESEEERRARVEAEMEERLAEVGRELRDTDAGGGRDE